MTDDRPFSYSDIRFADIQLLRYRVPAFEHLTLQQKLYVYHLTEAALQGRDILWDQNCRYNLPLRNLLETVFLHSTIEHSGKDWEAFLTYLHQIWFANGIHHHYSTDKFHPGFSENWFRKAIALVSTSALNYSEEKLEKQIRVIFDDNLFPKRVCQSGDDLLQASACNYYAPDVTQQEAEAFYARQKAKAENPDQPIMYGMNSRLEHDSDGQLFEHKYTTSGLYADTLQRISQHLNDARKYAENDSQRHIIDLLLQFYHTGDLHTFDDYTIAWVGENQGDIDFINGFTEVYGDPLGLKASWEGYVNILDKEATHRTEVLSQNAQWFEDNSPVDPRFKKKECRGVTARVVQAAMLGGDLYPSSAIGINLPNSNWIRSVHGSKSVTIGNLTYAYDQAAKGNGFKEEFIPDADMRTLIEKVGNQYDDLHTDLHECLGHGSGQLLPGVDPDALGVYGSTIEEARADLFGLYYIADVHMTKLGLTPDLTSWHCQYYTYMMNGLMTQLVRIEPGKDIEEAHMRNRALIAHWCLEQSSSGSMELVRENGKTFLRINNYDTLRQLVGQLLAEVQRIKSEGDFEAAKALVETFGVKVDKSLHEEVLSRYKSLNLAPYKGFINPLYTLVKDQKGQVTDVTVSYDESYDRQMLRYGQQYR